MLTRLVVLTVSVVAVMFVAMVGGAQATTIPNSSYEADGNFTGLGWDDPKPITGWTKGGIEFSPGVYLVGVLSPTAQSIVYDNGKSLDGKQLGHAADMQVFQGVYQSTLSTTVSDLVVGQQYQLTYYENARYGSSSPIDCSVAIGGTTIVGSHGVSPVGVAGNSASYDNLFHLATSSKFTATATEETLTFINQKPSSDGTTDATWLIDNIQISNVPEPSTLVLLGTGLFGSLAYAWRRRQV